METALIMFLLGSMQVMLSFMMFAGAITAKEKKQKIGFKIVGYFNLVASTFCFASFVYMIINYK